MNAHNIDTPDPARKEEEPAGAERYLFPGENLRIFSPDIQIKKIRFEAYLTNRRFFLIDQNDRKPGITAKEIPTQSIISSYLEESPAHEPVLVLTVRTSDDDTRIMKMVFMHNGEDRGREAEEWVHLISQTIATPMSGRTQTPEPAPEARPLTDTIVFPVSRTPQPDSSSPPDNLPPRVQSSYKPPADQAETTPAAVTPHPSASQIAYCYHCGKKLPEKANFCPFCGTHVHETTHKEESHLHLPLHQYREPPATPSQDTEKKGWRRFFGR